MKVIMLSPEWPSAERPQRGWHVYRRLQMLAANEVHLPVFHFRPGRDPREWWRQRQAFARILRQYQPDLLHGQWSYSYAIGGGLGVPMLVQFNGSDGNGWPGALPLFNQLNRQWSRWVSRRAAWSLFPSQEMQHKMGAPKRSSVLRPPVDERIFFPRNRLEARRRLRIGRGDHVWLFAGQAHRPLKRFDLAKAIVAWRQYHLNSGDHEVLLVAEGYPQGQMPYFYSAADGLLLVSEAEGSSNVAKEALMCGCPVFAQKVGDIPEYLSDFPSSIIMNPGTTTEQWGRQLHRAFSTDRNLIARQAREYFDASLYQKNINTLYNKITPL